MTNESEMESFKAFFKQEMKGHRLRKQNIESKLTSEQSFNYKFLQRKTIETNL